MSLATNQNSWSVRDVTLTFDVKGYLPDFAHTEDVQCQDNQ